MLLVCGRCGNFKDADNDGIGYCTACNIFMVKESGCTLTPKIDMGLVDRKSHGKMRNINEFLRMNYPEVNFNGEGK